MVIPLEEIKADEDLRTEDLVVHDLVRQIKCMMQSVPSAAMLAKCHLCQARVSQFFAANVLTAKTEVEILIDSLLSLVIRATLLEMIDLKKITDLKKTIVCILKS